MDGSRVTPATVDDLPALLEMMRDFNALEHVPFTPERFEPPLRRLLLAPDLGHVGRIVEGEDRRTQGYFVLTWGFDLEWSGRDAYLTELYLVPEARGRGVGRAALAAILEIAKGAGARALHLMVRDGNDAALRLYERAGFESPPRRFLTKELR